MKEKLNNGDIIVISHYLSPDNKKINHHSFVVVNNKKGSISGIEINLDFELKFDFVATVMSSIKDKTHKKKIQNYYPKNLIISFNDSKISNGNNKEGFIKANQLYYFKENKINYVKIGKLNKDTFNKLIDLIEINDKNGDIIANYNNIKEHINS